MENNLKDFDNINNFEIDKIDRYYEYQKIKNISLKEAVIKVNIGLDRDFYTNIEKINSPDSYLVLVNKYRCLGDFMPNDLKPLSYDSKYMLREKARDAFENLVNFAKTHNIFIRPYSAFRSYEYQKKLYDNYVLKDGKVKADTYSARAGHSEHQTGLAVDVWSKDVEYLNNSDAKWLKNNSYKYGFIVRYTKENMDITGYIEEPWHLRYVGDIAKDIYDKNITFEEYYDIYLKNNEY